MHPQTTTTSSNDNSFENSTENSSFPLVDLDSGTNGWSIPPPDLFPLRSLDYFTHHEKLPASDSLLRPFSVEWLRSHGPLRHLLAHRRPSHSLKSFLLSINLQLPQSSAEFRSLVFHFSSKNSPPWLAGSLIDRFVNGDDAFRNARFKMVNRIVKGPWMVRAAVGNYATCLLGKAVNCRYYRGEGYLEIDVDIGSSAFASAILKLALGALSGIRIDMGFVIEAQDEEELPENLLGAVRISEIELDSATFVESEVEVGTGGRGVGGFWGSAKVKHCDDEDLLEEGE